MSPSTGLLRTQSVIMHVTTEKTAIRTNADEKYGTTVLVLFSSSMSNVLDPKRAVDMCWNRPESSASPTAFRNASSHTEPLRTEPELAVKILCLVTTCSYVAGSFVNEGGWGYMCMVYNSRLVFGGYFRGI